MHVYNLFAVVFVVLIHFCSAEEGKLCENADEDYLCKEPCSDGMITYISNCEEMTPSQRTCLQPTSRDIGYFCDFSRCDCPLPLVLDQVTNKCVRFEDCSDQRNVVIDGTERFQARDSQGWPRRQRPEFKTIAQLLAAQFNDEQRMLYPYYYLQNNRKP